MSVPEPGLNADQNYLLRSGRLHMLQSFENDELFKRLQWS